MSEAVEASARALVESQEADETCGPPRFWQSALRGVRIAPSYCLCTTSTTLESARSYFPCSDLEGFRDGSKLTPLQPPARL